MSKMPSTMLQKILRKKHEQERNRPHYEILQLFALQEIEHHSQLTSEIYQLQSSIAREKELLDQLTEHCHELEDTGKKKYPRIIVGADFIGTEAVKPMIKQYYRKASNTFLREYIQKQHKYRSYQDLLNTVFDNYKSIKQREQNLMKVEEQKRLTMNEKRINNLNQDLRLRKIREEQVEVKNMIEEEINSHEGLLKEYEVKKMNYENRVAWSEKLVALKMEMKNEIQTKYNPESYRNFLKEIFNIRTKNEMMQRNLFSVVKQVQKVERSTKEVQTLLSTNHHFFVPGKCQNSSPKKSVRNSPKKSVKNSPSKRSSVKQFSYNPSPRKTTTKKKALNSPSARPTASSSMGNLLTYKPSRKEEDEKITKKLVF